MWIQIHSSRNNSNTKKKSGTKKKKDGEDSDKKRRSVERRKAKMMGGKKSKREQSKDDAKGQRRKKKLKMDLLKKYPRRFTLRVPVVKDGKLVTDEDGEPSHEENYDEYTCYHIAHWNVGRHAATKTKTQLKSRQQSYTKGRKPRGIVNVGRRRAAVTTTEQQ